MTKAPAQRRSLSWEHGVLAVERRGAMLGPVLFLLPGGRQVAPFYVAPWANEPQVEKLSGLMPRLRGEWPCVPFGFDGDREASAGWPGSRTANAFDEGHGFGANHDWHFVDGPSNAITAAIDYPAHHPIARMERRITPDPTAPALDIALTVHPRSDCRLPIGLHPTFRLPAEPGGLEIALPPDAPVVTYPGRLDASSRLAAGCFARAAVVPLADDGGTLDIRHLPFAHDAEELVQVLSTDGHIVLRNRGEGYAVRLSWDAGDFPSLLLWFSNRGRRAEPWRGRNLALGVEPVASAFDLGTAVSAGANPLNERGVPTAHAFRAGEAWTTRYRIEVSGGEFPDG